MHVCNEDFHFTVKAKLGHYHLSLHAFPTVEEYDFASSSDGYCRQASLRSRRAARSSEENYA